MQNLEILTLKLTELQTDDHDHHDHHHDFTVQLLCDDLRKRIFKKSRSCSMVVEEAGLYVTVGGRTKFKVQVFYHRSSKN